MKLSTILAAAALGASALAAPALADPAATAASPDHAERVQLARQIFDLSGGVKAVDQRIDAMLALSNRLIAANAKGESAKFVMAMQRDTGDELHKVVPALIDESVEAYADNLTTQELRDYVAWLSSPSGKSILTKLPAIRQDEADRSLPTLAALIPEMQHKVSERVCAELHCTAGERKVVADAMAKAFSTQKS